MVMVMLRLPDLWRSSCNRLSSSGRVMCRLVISYDFSVNKMLVVQLELIKEEEVAQRFVNGSWNKLINEIDEAEYRRKLEVLKSRVWTSEVLHFGVETTKGAEDEHSVLKLWLSTCHDDLDTVFLNIDSLIKGQIAEIKTLLKISKLKEKYETERNSWNTSPGLRQ
ncbi:hypothetical protein M9H77_26576 [Catharanthus roseus]|uniref:Uncharacterized protein n=1 Tax=Catharanthus roseus TaxID=4058 RepID=A0ACC0ACR5_CATRO|nr:hypothetical protein M9H77_26576 [Catharanthus roseus]